MVGIEGSVLVEFANVGLPRLGCDIAAIAAFDVFEFRGCATRRVSETHNHSTSRARVCSLHRCTRTDHRLLLFPCWSSGEREEQLFVFVR